MKTRGLVLALLMVLWSGCIFNPLVEDPHPQALPTPTHPQDLISNLEFIYNDDCWIAAARVHAYRDLFPPDDHPELPPVEFCTIGGDEDSRWGLEQEMRFHEALFMALENREIASLTLDIQHGPPMPIAVPAGGREDWQEIFAYDIDISVEWATGEILELADGQTRFVCSPSDGRWYINYWEEIVSR